MLFKAISFFFSPIWNVFDPYLNSIADLFSAQKAQRITIKSIFIFIVVSTLVGFAFLSYITFYYVYIPKIAHSKPVHLQYYHDRSVYSKIDFTKNGLYSRFLAADQAYDISIELEVPESDRNIDLGNFMIDLELKSKNNETVQSSSRPCILTYKSNLLRITSTIWKIVPLILGFVKEDQKLKVVMFENFIEDGDNPVTHAYITIPDKDPEVYDAKMLLDAHFRGLRYLMYYHYFSTGTVFIFLFIFWEIFFSIFSWKIIVSQWQTLSSSSPPPSKTIKYNNKGGGDDGNDENDDGRHERQETDNVKWLGNKLDDKTNTLGNDDGEDGNESESASNNDELSNGSDNDSVISNSRSINQTNTDYDESGYDTTEGNNYNTTDNSNNNTDVETSRRKMSRLSSYNGEDGNDDDDDDE